MLSGKGKEYETMNFEETELRLGLPGDQIAAKNNNGKRGFSEENISSVDLKLNLNLSTPSSSIKLDSDQTADPKSHVPTTAPPDPSKPPPKAQVVGWPPVRSYRKNMVGVQKNKSPEEKTVGVVCSSSTTSSAAAFVKVSMDGAPYLRKLDLKQYKTYNHLSAALAKLFTSFTIGNCGSQGTKDFLNESKLIDLLNGSEYVPTYQDKDGDWMLVGDVPWEMFVNSCKRLRIMKGSEAIGLAPRAVEKCKSRS